MRTNKITDPVAAAVARFATLYRSLRGNTRGNVLLLFGLALPPLMFATAMSVDYSTAMMSQTKLNAIADAAALAAVTKPMMNETMLTACTEARKTFTGQSGAAALVTLDATKPANLTIAITDSYTTGSPVTVICAASGSPIVPATLPIQRVATVTYGGESMNQFGGVLGLATLHISGKATAQTAVSPYIDIHVALDTSQSMGLGATEADSTALWNKTSQYNGNGCQFGCHVALSGEPFANEDLANRFGIRLRVNVLRDATAEMIQTAMDNSNGTNTYRFGLYRIGQTLTQLQPLTTDLNAAKSIATTLTLGPTSSAGLGDTNLLDTMNSMTAYIPAHGDGTSQARARVFLFLVTDGVSDVVGGCTWGHCTFPIDPATCQSYKTAGVTVGIVYTTYLPVKAHPLNPSDPALRDEYTGLIQRFTNSGYISPNPSDNSLDIAPALQACASTGWYFEASDEPSIHAAMIKLFKQASQTPSLTH